MALWKYYYWLEVLTCDHDENDGDVERVRVVLEARKEVHAKNWGRARNEGHTEAGDLHVQVHPDNLVAGFVLKKYIIFSIIEL